MINREGKWCAKDELSGGKIGAVYHLKRNLQGLPGQGKRRYGQQAKESWRDI